MRISLFWRTFLLLAISTLLSVTVTLQVFQWLNKVPPEQQIAWELASVVNLTRNALVSSIGEKRRSLLATLARDEGASISPLEATDFTEPLDQKFAGDFGGLNVEGISTRLRALLGDNTRMAHSVNGEVGVWISFEIDSDAYWLHLQQKRIRRHEGPPVLSIALFALALSLLATLALGRLINQPLRNLAGAINKLGAGESPPKLSEQGATEIASVNSLFNRMASDLTALEEDRRIALAGISHDIRSPLARLRMEIELSQLPDDSKNSMAEEIIQVDRIVGQFVDFARSDNETPLESVAVAKAVDAALIRYQATLDRGELKIRLDIDSHLVWQGRYVDLQRIVANLIDNALRYGRSSDGVTHLLIDAKPSSAARGHEKHVNFRFSDQGAGVSKTDLVRLTRPFARVDEARDSAGGSGLGLAIVERIARRYGGSCSLLQNSPSGLTVSLTL
jgi:two-component system, OmpR family, osmolarity sensor histidine kinase EnvZ